MLMMERDHAIFVFLQAITSLFNTLAFKWPGGKLLLYPETASAVLY
jgi:hypothetical protein